MNLDRALELMARAKRVRDNKVRKMMGKGWGPTKIGRELGVSRQRAQQIIQRLNDVI